MGLAGQRTKQRITADPQNRGWADDTTKVGFSMLQKLGWDARTGLGRDGTGMTDHIRVSVKLNNSGIGATASTADNWLDNTDAFSRLLADLNERVDAENASAAVSSSDEQPSTAGADAKAARKAEKRALKDQRKAEKKQLKKLAAEPTPAPVVAVLANARYAARAKYLRNKRLATSEAASLQEILGTKRVEQRKAADLDAPPTCTDSVNGDNDAYGSNGFFGGGSSDPAADNSAAAAMDPLMAMFVMGGSLGGSMPAEEEEEAAPTATSDAAKADTAADKPKKEKKSSSKKRSRTETDGAEEDREAKRRRKEAKKQAKKEETQAL